MSSAFEQLGTEALGFNSEVSNIFIATGLAKPNEKFMANPDLLMGQTGTLELKHRKYQKNDGTEGTANEIAKFYKPDEGFGGF